MSSQAEKGRVARAHRSLVIDKERKSYETIVELHYVYILL